VNDQVVKMSGSKNAAPVIIKRKKVSGGDGHHGGAWKVAYADFVTAMMAFFMLMWLLNATTEKQRKGLADYFAPSIPIHRVSSGSDDPFGGDSMFSEETLRKDGTGSTEPNQAEIRETQGVTGLDIVSESGDEEDPLKIIEEALLGRGGESFVTEEALKHIVTRVTDEGLITFAVPASTPDLLPDLDAVQRALQGVRGPVAEGAAQLLQLDAHPGLGLDARERQVLELSAEPRVGEVGLLAADPQAQQEAGQVLLSGEGRTAASVTQVAGAARARVEERSQAVATLGARGGGDPVVLEEGVAHGEGPALGSVQGR
jgi:chemotaxis protein MotB